MVFLSHCKTTKTSLVTPFAQILDSIHIPYWFDRQNIVCSDSIYKNIEQGIQQSIYCVAFIDFSYLKSNWTTEELMLFRQKELTSNKDFIIPIFCGISKEIVYQYFPWLDGRAFEYLNSSDRYIVGEKAMLICRLIGKILADLGITTDISSISRIPISPSCRPLYNLLEIIYNKKYFTTSDIRLSCIELCNIENILFSIIENTDVQTNRICHISHDYVAFVKDLLWNMSIEIQYDYIVTLRRIISLMIRILEGDNIKL